MWCLGGRGGARRRTIQCDPARAPDRALAAGAFREHLPGLAPGLGQDLGPGEY